MKLLAIAVGTIIVAIGIVGVAAPSILFDFGRSLQTTDELYVLAAIRVLFGVILLLVPATSRMPWTLRVIGVVMVLGGLATPLFGVERIHEIVDWLAAQGPLMTRAWAGIAVILGIFIVYAGGPLRRHTG
jgi:hypothetical protein